jgi:hypothetical protein
VESSTYAADRFGSCPQYYPMSAPLLCGVGVWVWNLGAERSGGWLAHCWVSEGSDASVA